MKNAKRLYALSFVLPFVLMIVLPSCGGGTDPIPPPSGFPSIPPPPSQAPPVAYDCAAETTVRGLIPSRGNVVVGRYYVEMIPRTAATPVTRAQRATAVRSQASALAALAAATEVTVLPDASAFSGRMSTTSASILARRPDVLYVQPEHVFSVSPKVVAAAPEWNLDRLDTRDLVYDGKYEPAGTGLGVNVVVVDTGGPSPNANEFGDRIKECFTAPGFSSCRDGHGHSTHVSGTVASKTYGVAKEAFLYHAKVLSDQGSGTTTQVVAGWNYAAEVRERTNVPTIISASLGGDDDLAIKRAVCDAFRRGVLSVVAAGNEDQDARLGSPANVLQAMTVAASDRTDRRGSFSSYGPVVDLFAPGVQVTSIGGTWDGTSMATPHVSGAAAIYYQLYPQSTPEQVSAEVVAAASRDKIQDAKDSPNAFLYVRFQ